LWRLARAAVVTVLVAFGSMIIAVIWVCRWPWVNRRGRAGFGGCARFTSVLSRHPGIASPIVGDQSKEKQCTSTGVRERTRVIAHNTKPARPLRLTMASAYPLTAMIIEPNATAP